MSLDQNVAYARQAGANGLKVIWAVHIFDGRPHSGYKWKLKLLNRTKDLPQTWGYYVGDEVTTATEAKQMRKLDAGIQARTKKPTLYVSVPEPDKVRPFVGMADVTAVDPYPIGHPALTAAQQQTFVWDTANWAAPMIRQGGHFGLVLQLFSWAKYGAPDTGRWPTPAEVEQMRIQAEAWSPRLILWWNFYGVSDLTPFAPYLAP
jgi:hypothetical protein